MNKGASIRNRLLALGLLALLLLIHAVQLAHHHEVARNTCHHPDEAHISALATCSVCEYQLARDAAPSLAPDLHLPKIEAPSPEYVVLPVGFSSSIGLYFSDRGPPAA